MDDLLIIDDVVAEENRITQSAIDQLKQPGFVTIKDERFSRRIYEYCKKLLEYSMKNYGSKEMAYALNIETLAFIGAVFGTARSVNISELVDKIKDSECVFLVLHNHPSDGPFSPRDLSTFFATPNMAILVVIGNMGTVYTIEKTDRNLIDANYLDIKKALIAYRQGRKSFEETVDVFRQYGIVYSRV